VKISTYKNNNGLNKIQVTSDPKHETVIIKGFADDEEVVVFLIRPLEFMMLYNELSEFKRKQPIPLQVEKSIAKLFNLKKK
jgi:hypothetical protein